MEQNKNRSHFDLLPLSVLVYSIPDRWTFLQLIVTVIVALPTIMTKYETDVSFTIFPGARSSKRDYGALHF